MIYWLFVTYSKKLIRKCHVSYYKSARAKPSFFTVRSATWLRCSAHISYRILRICGFLIFLPLNFDFPFEFQTAWPQRHITTLKTKQLDTSLVEPEWVSYVFRWCGWCSIRVTSWARKIEWDGVHGDAWRVSPTPWSRFLNCMCSKIRKNSTV